MKTKSLLKIGTLALFGAAATTGISSCSVDDIVNVLANALGIDSTNIDSHTGYDWDDEDLSRLEDDINIVTIVDDDDSPLVNDLPGNVNLTNYLPPIGDQGQYGTCVAWATAYNGRTYLYAREKGYTTSQLSNEANQFSPKYIFYALSGRTSCDGSYFEEVLDLIQQKGVATMQNMPYTNLGNCTGNPTSSQNTNASNYKIKSYREIDIHDPQNVKSYLNAGKVIIFGAKLGDEFMLADQNFNYLYQQTSYNYSGMHANHAMVCAGYDDNRGPNGCFLVVNSWGESWGNDGYIWVDQKYFCSDNFAFCGFVMYGFNENPVSASTHRVENPTSGMDLIPTSMAYNDYDDEDDPEASDDPLWRRLDYDVYNAGSSTINSSNDWGICLLYYNAYKASDYGVLLVDYYTDDFGNQGDNEGSWDADEANNYLGIKSQGYSWNNVDVKGGQSVAAEVYDDEDSYFIWDFRMPADLNGQYYIVLAADAFGSIDESNEDNNYLYYSTSDGKPLNFVNGVATNVTDGGRVTAKGKRACPKQNAESPCQTMVTEDNLNAYTTEEISALLNAEKKSGRLKAKAMQWQKSATGKEVLSKGKRKSK